MKPDLPVPADSEWGRRPVDDFILAALEAEGLAPARDADAAVLLRRVHYDLTGLPPTVEELRSFVADPSAKVFAKVVDELLAAGRIEEAEAFMEERRRFLLTQGIFIRRLNQAYFAFHGTYAAEPTSVDPIGDQVTALRVSSPTLRAFLDRVVTITSRADLEVAVGATP